MPEATASLLAGKRVVITRALAQSAELAQELSSAGALPIFFPLVAYAAPKDFSPFDRGLSRLGQFDWLILTSENAVGAVIERMKELGLSLTQTRVPKEIASVGPATTRAAEAAGFQVTHTAKTHSGVALAAELGDSVRGKKIFLPRSDRANLDLPAALNRSGAQVTEVIAYRTLPPAVFDQKVRAQISANETDAILFFSPTAVEHFAEFFGAEKLNAVARAQVIVAIGPITAAALEKLDVSGFVTSEDTNPKAALRAVELGFVRLAQHSSIGANRG